jgi:hypothetical protein
MKTFTGVCALALVVGACSSSTNPFTATTGTTTPDPGTGTTSSAVPAVIANDVDGISYDAAAQTLTVTGLTQDGTPLVNEYRHVATSFVAGYETFTAQNDPLGRHATAFVASREGVQAGMVITGGQFNKFFGGTQYSRDGAYEAPVAPEDRFDVTYHGNYAAGVNIQGPVTDLLPTVGLDDSIETSTQAGYIRGLMFVNVDLNDLSVEGQIYNRTRVGQLTPDTDPTVLGFQDLPSLVLVEGVLTDDGTFSGNIERDAEDGGTPGLKVGDFAGLIGGPEGVTMAGGTNVTDFLPNVADTNEIEYGVFVLDLCQAGDTDTICVNAQKP